jgi:putative hydroxymethylpyrimidine transport system permease protein
MNRDVKHYDSEGTAPAIERDAGTRPSPATEAASFSSTVGTSRRLDSPRRLGLAAVIWRYIPPVVIFLALIGVWELVAMFGGFPSYILPSPGNVMSAALFADRSDLMSAAATTVVEIVIGFGAAVTIGFLLALSLVASKSLRRGVYPLVIATQTIPILAIAPVMIIWFGFGILPKILVVTLFAFFPVAINTMTGMSSVERDTIYLMQVLGCSRGHILWRVRVPASLPYFFTGVRQAAVISAIGAIAGEWVGAAKGLGPLMIGANSGMQTNVVFAAILYLSVIAIAMFSLVSVIERLSLGWYYISRDAESAGKA